MPHDVIMPALGMAQDSALIVAWHKAPGDAVKAGDILMEVETDKSTMEVEAGHDGYVAESARGGGRGGPRGRGHRGDLGGKAVGGRHIESGGFSRHPRESGGPDATGGVPGRHRRRPPSKARR